MQQKKIWMLFLIIGISILRCKENTYVEVPYFYYKYVNTLGTDLKIRVFNRMDKDYKYTKVILAGDSIELSVRKSEGTSPFKTSCENGDSVIIQFPNNKCVSYWGEFNGNNRRGTGVFDDSRFKNDLYQPYFIQENSYYRYTIDSTDYKLAKPCK